MNPCTPADAHDDAECESYEEPSESNTKNATSDVESNSSDDGKEERNRRVDDTDGDVSQPASKIPRILYNLATCLTLVRRTNEIDSINEQCACWKNDSHVLMCSYARIFASLMGQDLQTLSKTACAAHLQTPAPLLNARQRRYKLNARPQ